MCSLLFYAGVKNFHCFATIATIVKPMLFFHHYNRVLHHLDKVSSFFYFTAIHGLTIHYLINSSIFFLPIPNHRFGYLVCLSFTRHLSPPPPPPPSCLPYSLFCHRPVQSPVDVFVNRVDRVVSFFSSRRNWDSLTPSPGERASVSSCG